MICLQAAVSIALLASTTFAAFSASEKQALVDAHNNYRSQVAQGTYQMASGSQLPQASDMLKVEWDATLEAHAQAHVDQCVWGHDSADLSAKGEGENLYTTGASSVAPATAVTKWMNELGLNDTNNPGHLGSNTPCKFASGSVDNKAVGHATQVIWAKSGKIGCAFKSCAGVSGYPANMNIYIACRYTSRGNFINNPIYVEGTACSACSGTCNNGLCEGTSTAPSSCTSASTSAAATTTTPAASSAPAATSTSVAPPASTTAGGSSCPMVPLTLRSEYGSQSGCGGNIYLNAYGEPLNQWALNFFADKPCGYCACCFRADHPNAGWGGFCTWAGPCAQI